MIQHVGIVRISYEQSLQARQSRKIDESGDRASSYKALAENKARWPFSDLPYAIKRCFLFAALSSTTLSVHNSSNDLRKCRDFFARFTGPDLFDL